MIYPWEKLGRVLLLILLALNATEKRNKNLLLMLFRFNKYLLSIYYVLWTMLAVYIGVNYTETLLFYAQSHWS